MPWVPPCSTALLWPAQFLFFLFHLGMIVTGSLFFQDCQNDKIPLYLVLGGFFGIVVFLIGLFFQCGLYGNHPGILTMALSFILVIFSCGIFAWYVAGWYWVSGSLQAFRDQKDSEFCNRSLYIMAFSMLVLPLGLLALAAVALGICGCLRCCSG